MLPISFLVMRPGLIVRHIISPRLLFGVRDFPLWRLDALHDRDLVAHAFLLGFGSGPDDIRNRLTVFPEIIVIELRMEGVMRDGRGAPCQRGKRGGITHFVGRRRFVRPHPAMLPLSYPAHVVCHDSVGVLILCLQQRQGLLYLAGKSCRADNDWFCRTSID